MNKKLKSLVVKEEKEEKKSKKKDATSEQINRSLGYLLSIATEPESLYRAMIKAEPLLNKKLLKRLSAAIHVIHKVKEGKASNEDPK